MRVETLEVYHLLLKFVDDVFVRELFEYKVEQMVGEVVAFDGLGGVSRYAV